MNGPSKPLVEDDLGLLAHLPLDSQQRRSVQQTLERLPAKESAVLVRGLEKSLSELTQLNAEMLALRTGMRVEPLRDPAVELGSEVSLNPSSDKNFGRVQATTFDEKELFDSGLTKTETSRYSEPAQLILKLAALFVFGSSIAYLFLGYPRATTWQPVVSFLAALSAYVLGRASRPAASISLGESKSHPLAGGRQKP